MLSHIEKVVTPPTSYVEQSRRPRCPDCNLNLQVTIHVEHQSINNPGTHLSQHMSCRADPPPPPMSISDSHFTTRVQQKENIICKGLIEVSRRMLQIYWSPSLAPIKTPPQAEPTPGRISSWLSPLAGITGVRIVNPIREFKQGNKHLCKASHSSGVT